MNRYVFIGSVNYSGYCLRALLEMNINMVDIMCPYKEVSTFNSDYFDLGEVAKDYSKSVYYFEKIKDEARHIEKKRPDIIFPNCEDCNPEQKDGQRNTIKIPNMSIGDARRLSSTFIKNIHTFRDDMADRLTSPTEKGIIF